MLDSFDEPRSRRCAVMPSRTHRLVTLSVLSCRTRSPVAKLWARAGVTAGHEGQDRIENSFCLQWWSTYASIKETENITLDPVRSFGSIERAREQVRLSGESGEPLSLAPLKASFIPEGLTTVTGVVA